MDPLVGVPRYYGFYRAIVTQRDDPKKLVRLRLRVKEICGDNETAWAPIVSGMTGDALGAVVVPAIDSLVVVGFEAGDSNRPLVFGGVWAEPGSQTQIPKSAYKADPDFLAGRGSDQATGAFGASLQEPADARDPKYPQNTVLRTSKHLLEVDNTDGKERISITHANGSRIDLNPDGSLVIQAKGMRYVVVAKDDAEHIVGKQDVVVEKDQTLFVGGKQKTQIENDQTIAVQGKRTTSIQSEDLQVGDNFDLTAGGQVSIKGAVISIEGAQVMVGPGPLQGQAVTTLTHPFDYISGLPILGTPAVLVG